MDIARVCRFTGLGSFRAIITRFIKNYQGYTELHSVDGTVWIFSYIFSYPDPQSPTAKVRISFDNMEEHFRVRSYDVDGDIMWERTTWTYVGHKVNIVRHTTQQQISKLRRSMVNADYLP